MSAINRLLYCHRVVVQGITMRFDVEHTQNNDGLPLLLVARTGSVGEVKCADWNEFVGGI